MRVLGGSGGGGGGTPRTVNPDLYSPVNHFSGFSVAGSKYRIDSWYGVLNDFPGFNAEPNAIFLRADAPRARRAAAPKVASVATNSSWTAIGPSPRSPGGARSFGRAIKRTLTADFRVCPRPSVNYRTIRLSMVKSSLSTRPASPHSGCSKASGVRPPRSCCMLSIC